jgi:hypothetical protein
MHIRFLLGILGALLIVPFGASAASIMVSPAAVRVTAGDIVTVEVVVNSSDQAINDAEGMLSFPTGFLKVLSVDTSHSIFPLWIQAPAFSNTDGTLAFAGGVPSPGFMGTRGSVMKVTFQAKKAGTATLSFSNVSVLANDGLGTDVTRAVSGATFQIVSAPAPTPASKPVLTQTVPAPAKAAATTSPAIATTTPVLAVTESPFIDFYTQKLVEGQQFVMSGSVASGTASVLVFDRKGKSDTVRTTVRPTSRGSFIFVGPSWSAGNYEIWTSALAADGTASAETEHVFVMVSPISFAGLGGFGFTFSSFLIAVLLIALSQLIFAVWSEYRLHAFKKWVGDDVIRSEREIQKGLLLLKEDAEEHMKRLEHARSAIARGTEEKEFKADLESDIDDLGTLTKKDLENIRTSFDRKKD